jgi:catechol 2,3-dioxygenase-like lactoylglutathione lyase family enzyme
MAAVGTLHHLELYVSALDTSMRFWRPLLEMLGYAEYQVFEGGVSYKLQDTYIVFVQAERSYAESGYHRKRIGLNHLAFHAGSHRQVDEITTWIRDSGYTVLYPESHPYAGGKERYVLYCEDPDRIKVEICSG